MEGVLAVTVAMGAPAAFLAGSGVGMEAAKAVAERAVEMAVATAQVGMRVVRAVGRFPKP